MSGRAADTPSDTADLVGPVMVRLVGAVPHVQELLSQPVIVGGLAVMIRLGTSHRATQDLDALRRRHEGGATGLEFLSAAGATEMDEVGGILATDRGEVRVDVLESGPHELDRTFTDATDRLEATAHLWTLETATPVLITATAIEAKGGSTAVDTTQAEALVARPGPLVAMKMKASVDRFAAKEATDLLDVVRLVTDPATAGLVASEFAAGDPQLRADVATHVDQQFRRNSLRTRRLINDLNSPQVDDELISGAIEFLEGALSTS